MFSSLYISVRRSFINVDYLTQIKNYGRWTHRKPRQVLPPESQENGPVIDSTENYELHNEQATPNNQIRWRLATPQIKPDTVKSTIKKHKKKDILKEVTHDMLETVIDAKGDFIYTKLPDKDVRVTTLLTSVHSNSKQKKDIILLEGKRLIKEALQNNCRLQYLLFSQKSDVEWLKPFLPKSGATLFKMPYKEIQLWSDLTTSPGIMGIFKKPDTANFTSEGDTLPIIVICDSVREPGNLGSILRTCAGAGCHSVILTKGCVNLWEPKVTRSACGAHFQLQIHTKLDWSDIIERLKPSDKIFMADNNLFNTTSESAEETAARVKSIPLVPYYGIQVDKSESIVIIVGGETEGLSEEAYKLVYTLNGLRLNVPLTTNIDSLNSGVALGVILFEMKKQILFSVSENRNIIHNTR